MYYWDNLYTFGNGIKVTEGTSTYTLTRLNTTGSNIGFCSSSNCNCNLNTAVKDKLVKNAKLYYQVKTKTLGNPTFYDTFWQTGTTNVKKT